jgi:hypothetical protein
MGGFKSGRGEVDDDLSVTGQITATGGLSLAKTTATHDLGTGASDTQNVRGGTVTVTINGTISATAGTTAFNLTINSDKVLATDVIVASASVTGLRLSITGVSAGSFVITGSNYSGGTLANDSTAVINWVIL